MTPELPSNPMDACIAALAAIEASSLQPEVLAASEAMLDAFPDDFRAEAAGSINGGNKEKTELEAINALNQKTSKLNKELERLKQLRATLNLERLDPIISKAARIVRSLYSVTATWEAQHREDDQTDQ